LLFPHLKDDPPALAKAYRNWELQSKKAGATTINTGAQAPAASLYDKYQDKYEAQSEDVRTSSQLVQAIERIETGALAGFKHYARGILDQMGVEVDQELLANTDYAQTLFLNEVMKQVAKTKGAVSEKEMELFEANLAKSKGGNLKIARMQLKFAQNKRARALHMAEWIANNPDARRVDADREARRWTEASRVLDEQDIADLKGGAGDDTIGTVDPAAREKALMEELKRRGLQ
jgi:hypothetical protein